ncbi:MAG: NRDE family protein [Saprospiraceae bacterium]|nr:NRDE family protein [Saprospiraceae bacterium]
MCTVTYIPTRAGFILTHNRDEAPTRSPTHISREKPADDVLLFPRDTKAGGAWVVAAGNGDSACLLNGAFIKHHHAPPYRRSRGLVMLDFFNWKNPGMFFREYDLDGIEPFTFLYFRQNDCAELRWDGTQRHLRRLQPDEPHFWCSATLYPPDMQIRREQVFRQWLSKQSSVPAPKDLRILHRTGSVGDPENDFVMNRGGRVCTVSITQIILTKGIFRMHYLDLLEGNRDTRQVTTRERPDN